MVNLWHSLTQHINCKFKLVKCIIQNILHECGLSYVWLTNNVENENWLLNVEKLVLFDQFQQKWDFIASSKGLNCHLFTNNIFVPRNYSTTFLDLEQTIINCQFETGSVWYLVSEIVCLCLIRRRPCLF